MADKFQDTSTGISGPAKNGSEVTASDAADLATASRALYVGGAGAVKITTTLGDTITFSNVPGGAILPVCARRVWSTGTTATGIVAIW
jgi:hypothetical protein